MRTTSSAPDPRPRGAGDAQDTPFAPGRLPAASARSLTRLRRPRWRDPRLLIGIALVLASVIAGGLLVRSLSETTTVLVTRTEIVPGQAISTEVLTTAEVRMGDLAGAYLVDSADLAADATALRSIGAGEMIPLSAIGAPEDGGLRVITLDLAAGAAITVNQNVEVWASRLSEDGTPASERIVSRAVVRGVSEDGTLRLGGRSVDVLVPAERVPDLLASLIREDRIDLVPVPDAGSAG